MYYFLTCSNYRYSVTFVVLKISPRKIIPLPDVCFFTLYPDMTRWQMMYENERNKNSQAARDLFSRSCCAKESKEREKERRERGMLHFHVELPLPHNHPPLGPSTKISKVPEYPFTWDGGGDLMVYNPSARIYHEQLWHLRGMIFRDREGRGRWILWADGGKGGWDRERENKTEPR